MKKVFLGGTCNNSNWRDILIKKLNIDYFNPIVDNWTPECMAEEIRQRKLCDFVLYVITPRMTGVYSIAEVVDDSNKQPDKTIFCVLTMDDTNNGTLPTTVQPFTESQLKSLSQVSAMVKKNGGSIFNDLDSVANYLNNQNIEDLLNTQI